MMNINRLLCFLFLMPLPCFGQYCDEAQTSAGFPSDPTCETAICDLDSWCCDVEWDGFCASEAATNASCTNCLSTAGGSDPCDDINTIGGCGQELNVTMSGSGEWNVNDCGWNTPGVEVIYEYTPTTSGVHSIDVSDVTGGYVDFFWKPASTGCDETGWNCIDDVGFPGSYGSMSWTSGETYYILLSPEGTGSYDVTFQLECPNPDPVSASDCDDAVSICTDASFSISPNGYGLEDEICMYCTSNPSTNPASTNYGCLLDGELNSTWMVINVETGGQLEFTMGDGGGSNCYDWSMWPYDASTCDGISDGTLAPVRCNYNAGLCNSMTGIADVVPAGGVAGDFEPSLTVNNNEQYIVMLSNWSSVETDVPLNFGGTAGVNCVALPVEFLAFDATNIDNQFNELNWSTASEVNNSHFEIEKSEDGIEFNKIGSIEGSGTSLEENHYMFRDSEVTNGISYYRLKQVDFDGKFKYSEIKSVSNTVSGYFEVVNVYPVPSSQILTVEISAGTDEVIHYTIMDTYGRKIKSNQKKSLKGTNEIELNVDEFSPGIYNMVLKNENSTHQETIKFIVQ